MKNLNTEFQLITSVGVPLSEYDYDSASLDQYNGTVIKSCKVKWEDIDLENRTYQIRSGDLDSGHIAKLRENIANSRLKSWPIGQWDSQTNKIVVLSGHHRLNALRDIEDNKYDITYRYPILVVDFQDELERDFFLHEENNHAPAKGGTKEDAIDFLKKLTKRGNFKGLNEQKKRSQCYGFLTKYFPSIKTKAKDEIFQKAVLGRSKTISRSKTVSNDEFESNQMEHWGFIAKGSGLMDGNDCYIATNYDPMRKCVIVQYTNRAKQHVSNSTIEPMSVNLMFRFRRLGGIDKQRNKALEEVSLWNSQLLNNKIGVVESVAFAPQMMSPKETEVIVYNWNSDTEEFELE